MDSNGHITSYRTSESEIENRDTINKTVNLGRFACEGGMRMQCGLIVAMRSVYGWWYRGELGCLDQGPRWESKRHIWRRSARSALTAHRCNAKSEMQKKISRGKTNRMVRGNAGAGFARQKLIRRTTRITSKSTLTAQLNVPPA